MAKMEKGNKRGKQFSKAYQPRKNGRKPSLINQFILSFNMEDESRQISNEDTKKLMAHILSCNKAQFEAMSRNPDLPISILSMIFAIADDLKNKKTYTVDKIVDRLYGKEPMIMELKEAKNLPLIPSGLSRQGYLKMLKNMQDK